MWALVGEERGSRFIGIVRWGAVERDGVSLGALRVPQHRSLASLLPLTDSALRVPPHPPGFLGPS